MAILDAVVARGTTVLTEFIPVTGNTGAVARRILQKLPGRIPFSYLEDIQMRFMKNYGKVVFMLQLTPMNDEFSRVLHQQMEFFSSNPSADTLNRVRGEAGELRTIMVDNIGKILEKGDWIEILVDKTATMQDGALNFRKQSKRLHRALWMKNAKLLVLLTCLFVLFLYLIIAACCGGITLPSCRL